MNEAYLEFKAQLVKAWRWRWLGIPVCWLFAIVGTGFVVLMPDQYQSQAIIQVDSDSALTPLMKGMAVSSDVQSQIRTMHRTLLTRPNLQQVARSVDLDLNVTNDAEEQALIEELESRIRVKAIDRGVFELAYVDVNPTRARDVVQSLLTIFTETNLGENRNEMVTAESFLSAQIINYEAQLTSAEREMANFRAENIVILSGGVSFVERIRNAAMAVKEIDFQIAEATAVRDQLSANLARTPRFNTMESAPPVLIDGQLVSSTYSQIQGERKRLDDLLVRYTENHPDVIASQKRLSLLIDRYNREKSGQFDTGEETFVNTSKVSNPIHEQLSLRLVDANENISVLEQRKKTMEGTLKGLEANATRAPEVEAQMQSLNRDYDIIKRNFEALLSRREAARITLDMAAWTDTVRYKTYEPPQVPAVPSGPPRLLYLGMVLLFAFGAGGGTSFIRSQLEDSFAVASKLNEAFGLPVIGSISRIEGLAEKTKSALSNTTFIVAAAAPVGLIIFVAILLPYLAFVRNTVNLTLIGG